MAAQLFYVDTGLEKFFMKLSNFKIFPFNNDTLDYIMNSNSAQFSHNHHYYVKHVYI